MHCDWTLAEYHRNHYVIATVCVDRFEVNIPKSIDNNVLLKLASITTYYSGFLLGILFSVMSSLIAIDYMQQNRLYASINVVVM